MQEGGPSTGLARRTAWRNLGACALLWVAAAAPALAGAANPSARIRLGRRLFFDPLLSRTGRVSCATCHDPEAAWASHRPVDEGVGGGRGTRNTVSILTAPLHRHQFWDGRAGSLEAQAWGPILNPLEMGETRRGLVRKLQADPEYRRLFRTAFGGGPTPGRIARALAAFERSLRPGPSPYDRFLRGDLEAMTSGARRGLEVFRGKGRCVRCHRGPDLTDQGFANIGAGRGEDAGRERVTRDPRDRGAFRTPSLREVAQTSPYFHDGSAADLVAVIEHYDRGGRPGPDLDPRIMALGLTAQEKVDLVAFLEALSAEAPPPAHRPPARQAGGSEALGPAGGPDGGPTPGWPPAPAPGPARPWPP